MLYKNIISTLTGLLLFVTLGYSQGEKDLLKKLVEEDRSAVDAIVLYPEDIRTNIFIVATHPELLIKLSGMQEKTQLTFRNLIKDLSQEEQAKFYELTRYPGLIRDLAGESKRSNAEIEAFLINYPQEVHATALEVGRREYKTLQQIYQLNHTTKQAFDALILPYPERSQAAIRSLVNMPEILSILVDNIDLTILVGDVYKNDPAWVQTKARELNIEVARSQAEELEDYKKQLEEDPEAYQEMLDAAELYAKDNNISASQQQPQTTVKVVYSYPYWYGYPYWYTYPYWAPVPYYYHTGFYIGPGGAVIIVGLPSYHYVHWHYTYYPTLHVHLHAHYYRHYQRHPHGHGGFHAAVNVNINKNIKLGKNRIPDRQKELPGKAGQGKPDLKLGDKRPDRQDLDRFKANDNHRGNWSNRQSAGSGGIAQRRGN
ncbi:MAG: DUF3300 domain-containing protein [Saprospiraceae bacterium]|nr:hypothetical protein [Lewinella sp.]